MLDTKLVLSIAIFGLLIAGFVVGQLITSWARCTCGDVHWSRLFGREK